MIVCWIIIYNYNCSRNVVHIKYHWNRGMSQHTSLTHGYSKNIQANQISDIVYNIITIVLLCQELNNKLKNIIYIVCNKRVLPQNRIINYIIDLSILLYSTAIPVTQVPVYHMLFLSVLNVV